jgi:hypothetical protein
MVMTRKDFVLIADLLSDTLDGCENESERLLMRGLAFDFSVMLATWNANFDRDRFLTAAGVR